MKLIKWIVIIIIVVAVIFLLKDLAGYEKNNIEKINEHHTEQAEKYTIGIEKNLKQKINKAVKQGYEGLPMTQ